ncbi:MAG TPA: T9SS type A sorting domain-containing protein [Crocinitomix sp.]|nr:T9SS type A sorting domain-containing protein [Crocinitomix sp.]
MMKKIITSFLSLTLLASASFAQTNASGEVTTPCGTVEMQNRIFDEYPQIKAQCDAEQTQFQQDYETMMQTYNPNTDRVQYVVPVVVHIVHLDGPENISDQQVYDVIDLLNEDYSATNSDLSLVIPAFSGIIGNADFVFKLAKLDPNGNCTNGITRTYSTTTDDNGFSGTTHPIVDAVQAEHGTWSQNKYLNIFVCRSTISGAAAYTYNPANWYPVTGMLGGIICLYNYFGNTGTGSSRHTVSHEVGHWFNLSHTWGPNNDQGQSTSCSTDDGVSDTPNTIGTNGTCDLAQTTCGSLDNIQNIMDYSSCDRMFTQGQVARMITSITSTTAGRNNLWTAQNLTDTGVNLPGEACEVRILESNTVICEGGTVTFTDNSYSNITSRTWTFTGGDITTSTDSIVTVTYNTVGSYDVTLEVTGGATTLSQTLTNHITVIPAVGLPATYLEDFESYTSLPDNTNFFVSNPGNNNAWDIDNTNGFNSNQCLKLANYNQPADNRDAFMSTTIDLSSFTSADNVVMTFDYAYKKRYTGTNEQLLVFGSIDCGDTWFVIKSYDSDDLTSSVLSTNFNPADDNDWDRKQVTIYPLFLVDNFRYKIEFVSSNGNNIYIDNINLLPVDQVGVGINEIDLDSKLTVYPNPATSIATISYYSSIDTDATIEIYNVIGEKVQTVYNGSVSQGPNTFNADLNSLSKGVYFVSIKDVKGTKIVKLVKE